MEDHQAFLAVVFLAAGLRAGAFLAAGLAAVFLAAGLRAGAFLAAGLAGGGGGAGAGAHATHDRGAHALRPRAASLASSAHRVVGVVL